eukprot:5298096-Karenia_brevis.AAC.1
MPKVKLCSQDMSQILKKDITANMQDGGSTSGEERRDTQQVHQKDNSREKADRKRRSITSMRRGAELWRTPDVPDSHQTESLFK